MSVLGTHVRVLAFSAALCAALGAGPSRGHEDTTFTIGPDGLVSGLPEIYGSIFLHVDLAGFEMCGDVDPSVTISHPAGDLSFPPCLMPLFDQTRREWVVTSGSWYHSSGGLPPYIAFDFPYGPPGYDKERLHVLIGLENGAPLQFNLIGWTRCVSSDEGAEDDDGACITGRRQSLPFLELCSPRDLYEFIGAYREDTCVERGAWLYSPRAL